MEILLYIHLLAATVWVGGLITMGGLVPSVRKASADRAVIKAMARRFGVISWMGLGTLVVTGTSMVLIAFNLTTTLQIKLTLVAVSVALALWHSLSAGTQTAKVRGMIQGVLLILALVIVWFALQI